MIRTKEELIDRVSRERAWRIKEISEIKNVAKASTMSTTRKRVLCRSGIALLYAHWEGFVKKSGTYFLEYIASQRLTVRELQPNFVTIILKGRIDHAAASRKYSAFESIMTYLRNNQETRARLPYKDVVDTTSNLSTSVLKEISWCLGIDYSVFSTREKLIDTRLVGRRNNVAHGESIEIDQVDFNDLTDEVVGLINTFKAQLENAAVSELYRIAPTADS